jgi:serine/threonine protein kinase
MTRWLFRVDQKITDPYGITYRIVKPLGSGGFAQTFHAEQLTPKGRRHPRGTGTVCLKVTTDLETWHGEAYFGLLTRSLTNVVKYRSSFPLRVRGAWRYVLVLELNTGDTVQDWIEAKPKPWTGGQVVNALCPLARVVGALHASGAMHRDIKPSNVFIGNRRSLCLADFGIARHGLSGHGAAADFFTEAFAATSLLKTRDVWLPSDDVYQLGLLGLSLLLAKSVSDPDWRTLRHQVKDERLHQVLYKATGPRADRYASAVEFHGALTALRRKARGR